MTKEKILELMGPLIPITVIDPDGFHLPGCLPVDQIGLWNMRLTAEGARNYITIKNTGTVFQVLEAPPVMPG